MELVEHEGGAMQKILILDETDYHTKIIYDFLNLHDIKVTRRKLFINEGAFKKDMLADIDLILINFNDIRDRGAQIINRISVLTSKPIVAVLHHQSDLQYSVAFALGCKDCIQFPYSENELIARIKNALKRMSSVNHQESVIKIGELEINPDSFEVKKLGKSVYLTRTEFLILHTLMTSMDKVFKKDELYQLLWNDYYYDNGNALNVHIRRLRKKIEDNPDKPKFIKTKWGIGYRFELE